MKQVYDYVIGIDPDSVKSGVAMVKRDGRAIVDALSIYDLICVIVETMKSANATGQKVLIVVEAGWMNESNWHLRTGENLAQAAAKGRSVGRCEQTGRIIIEMLTEHFSRGGIKADVVGVKPLRKMWKGKDGKITHDEIKQITGIKQGRTNQEERDALLLAWIYAGLKIRLTN